MLAKPVAQRGVQQMGGAMVGASCGATLGIDMLLQHIADIDRTVHHLSAKRMELAQRLRCILNLSFKALKRDQFSGVTDLPAAFAIEGSLVEDDGDCLALLRL